VTLGLFKESRSRVTIYALDVLCAQLTRDLFATAKLLLKVLLQKGMWSFPGQSLWRQTILGQDDSRTHVSRTRRFPDRRFPDNTFFRHHFCRAMLCISAGYAVALSLSVHLSVRHVRVFCQNEQTYPTIFHHPVAIILGFPYQTLWQYSGGNHPSLFNAAVECK